jgi:hypothetical protein
MDEDDDEDEDEDEDEETNDVITAGRGSPVRENAELARERKRSGSPAGSRLATPTTTKNAVLPTAPGGDTTVLAAIVEVNGAVDQKGAAEEQVWRGRYLVLKAEGVIEAAEWKGGKQAWRLGLHGLVATRGGVCSAEGKPATTFELQLRRPIERKDDNGGAGDGVAAAGQVGMGAGEGGVKDGERENGSMCMLLMRFHNSEDIDKWMLALRACCKNAKKPLEPTRAPHSSSSIRNISSFFSPREGGKTR